MDLFYNAKTVRLRSHHHKYLFAEDDELSVCQDRNGSARNAKWGVEFVSGSTNAIRLKSCYGKYLTASNVAFLLGMTGYKVIQSKPARLDSSVEWEPTKDGSQVRLKTRYGNYLRANGGLPPWRNSVTHDVPHRTATQDWVVWDVDILQIDDHPSTFHEPEPEPTPTPKPKSEPVTVVSPTPHQGHGQGKVGHADSFGSNKLQTQQSSGRYSPPKDAGRQIYYRIAGDYSVDESVAESSFTFKGHTVTDLTRKLEEETGLEDIFVCMHSPLNGKLYPLRLQLPPNSTTMHIVVVPATSTLAEEFS